VLDPSERCKKVNDMTYSIVIPAYNEGARLGATLEKVLAYVNHQGWDAEVSAHVC
jgi:cellulose synthase/poly-beta-1,6-N-acetylglucosamine synthase-like glycosyltransferase